MTFYDGQTSVIRRVSVSATNVPNFVTIFKDVCKPRPFNAYVQTSLVTSPAGIPYNGALLALMEAKFLTDNHETWHTCSSQCAEHVSSVAEPPSDVIDV
ncbi:hypothetical protein DPMN_078184 [Dreissena polymorpha]|uniref:Uncharacterized protein n=1 Tax=Dreissena polymorpha TaxID=45954 RepID=A0A9D3YLS4_DREPO|nr:hypothetical protein DPMN_078184 [Dreissena polymorpha]